MSWKDRAASSLHNDRVTLSAITEGDRENLRAVAMDTDIWRYFTSLIATDTDFDSFFDRNLADQLAGRRAVYVITDRGPDRVVGSMSLLNLAEADRRLEIGASWLGRDSRGTGVNHWTKLLLLEHAFDTLEAERVEFKTDALNTQARRGLRNIGATEEGILRSYSPMPGGRRRDAVFYSILRTEWPRVRAELSAGRKATVAL